MCWEAPGSSGAAARRRRGREGTPGPGRCGGAPGSSGAAARRRRGRDETTRTRREAWMREEHLHGAEAAASDDTTIVAAKTATEQPRDNPADPGAPRGREPATRRR